jgi:hypothetical protein
VKRLGILLSLREQLIVIVMFLLAASMNVLSKIPMVPNPSTTSVVSSFDNIKKLSDDVSAKLVQKN